MDGFTYSSRSMLNTRRQLATILTIVVVWFGVLIANKLRTDRDAWPLAFLVFVHVVVIVRCLLFLRRQEAKHAHATEEMEFVFELATTLTVAGSAILLIAISRL